MLTAPSRRARTTRPRCLTARALLRAPRVALSLPRTDARAARRPSTEPSTANTGRARARTAYARNPCRRPFPASSCSLLPFRDGALDARDALVRNPFVDRFRVLARHGREHVQEPVPVGSRPFIRPLLHVRLHKRVPRVPFAHSRTSRTPNEPGVAGCVDLRNMTVTTRPSRQTAHTSFPFERSDHAAPTRAASTSSLSARLPPRRRATASARASSSAARDALRPASHTKRSSARSRAWGGDRRSTRL